MIRLIFRIRNKSSGKPGDSGSLSQHWVSETNFGTSRSIFFPFDVIFLQRSGYLFCALPSVSFPKIGIERFFPMGSGDPLRELGY